MGVHKRTPCVQCGKPARGRICWDCHAANVAPKEPQWKREGLVWRAAPPRKPVTIPPGFDPVSWFRVQAAAEHFGVTVEAILTGTRRPRVVSARHVACWLLRDTGRSFPDVGRTMRRDHSTVIYAVRKVEEDPELLEVARGVLDGLTERRAAS